MAAALVTLQQAKDHLQLPTMAAGHPDEADLQLKLDQAEAIILDFLAAKADPAWTPATVPPQVTAAILLLLGGLYRHRGDVMDTDPGLWAAIDRLLMGIRYAALS
jgi:hypothetical protein